MDKEGLLQIADNQDDFLERMSMLHKQRLQDAITSLEKRIVDRISILQTTNAGNLVGPKANLAISQRIHTELTTLFDEEYGAAARTTVDEYRRDLPFIQDYYKQMGEAAEFTGLDKKMIDTLKKRDFAEYSQYGQKAQDQIASAMYDNVVAQAPFSSLVAAISGALVGHKDARGRPLSMYAEQMANDGIMNFHNAVMMKKAEDLGFDTFLYYGNIIKDSRDFCIKRAGNVYTKEQIQGWTFAWQGKSGPAMSDRGGYNCRHHWQPVRKGWIPEGGIEVQSAFDRAGVMPVNKLPEAIRNDPKFKAYQAWQRSVLVDKKPLNATAISESVGGKRNSIASWMNRWKKGLDLPEGWQSVVRDLEAEAGGFERAVAGPVLPVAPVVQEVVAELKPLSKDLPGDWKTAKGNLMSGAEGILKERGYSGDSEEFFQEVFGTSKAEMERRLKGAVDESSVWMAIKEPTLRTSVLIKNGGFKNSLETGKGAFKTVAEARVPKERAMFGITADIKDYDQFPKYGFLSSSTSMNNPKMTGFGYGDTFVKFKPGIKDRSTFTIGDSYNGNMAKGDGTWIRIAPASPVNQPSADSLISMTQFQRGMLGKGKALYGAKTMDELASVVEYAEAQIYGKLDSSDIEAIYSPSKKGMAAIKAAVKKAGLDIEVLPLQYDHRLKAIWTQDYGKESLTWRFSLSPENIERLPKVWLEKLGVPEMLSNWVKNTGWKPPAIVEKEIMKSFNKEVLTLEERKTVTKWFYEELPKKSEGKLGNFLKVLWEDYRPSKVGWLDDVAAQDLIDNPRDEMFKFAI